MEQSPPSIFEMCCKCETSQKCISFHAVKWGQRMCWSYILSPQCHRFYRKHPQKWTKRGEYLILCRSEDLMPDHNFNKVSEFYIGWLMISHVLDGMTQYRCDIHHRAGKMRKTNAEVISKWEIKVDMWAYLPLGHLWQPADISNATAVTARFEQRKVWELTWWKITTANKEVQINSATMYKQSIWKTNAGILLVKAQKDSLLAAETAACWFRQKSQSVRTSSCTLTLFDCHQNETRFIIAPTKTLMLAFFLQLRVFGSQSGLFIRCQRRLKGQIVFLGSNLHNCSFVVRV